MARTYTISGSLVTVAGDPFDEGKDDFLEFDLQDEEGVPLVDNAVLAITATLRSLEPDTVINDREDQDVFGVNGGALSGGTFRLDLSGDGDMVAVGARTRQQRELTILIAHSVDKVLPIVTRFELRAFADVPSAT
jgi:hypothetical protein